MPEDRGKELIGAMFIVGLVLVLSGSVIAATAKFGLFGLAGSVTGWGVLLVVVAVAIAPDPDQSKGQAGE